jgi:hypothetical protein
MSEPHEQPQAENDEAVLDAELQASIEAVKAGNVLEPSAPAQSEATDATGSTGATGAEDEGDGTSQPAGPDGEAEFRIPNKGKFESDESYEKRIELFDLVKRRKAATTPEAKEALSAEIKKAKGELKTLGATERFTQPKVEAPTGEDDPNLDADKATAKRLGLLTREEAAEIIQQERIEQEVQSNLKTFVERKSELKDEDVREVFFDFVDANYVWQGKSGKDLIAVLEMAHEAMFRPSETVQERVLKAAGVQEKVNAMQFPGGTGAKTTFSPEMQKSIDELKATGMSEDKAIELLSE